MTVNNPDSLRKQLIDAMVRSGRTHTMAEAMFDHYLWPVLDAAMKAGELLVSRNTVPQQPIAVSVKSWLKSTIAHVKNLEPFEATMSKAQALKIIHQFAVSAEHALEDAERVENPLMSVSTTIVS